MLRSRMTPRSIRKLSPVTRQGWQAKLVSLYTLSVDNEILSDRPLELLFSSFVIGDTKDVVCRYVIKFSEKYQFLSANIGDTVFYFAVLLLCGLYHFCDLGLAKVTVFPKISDPVHNEFSFAVFFIIFYTINR